MQRRLAALIVVPMLVGTSAVALLTAPAAPAAPPSTGTTGFLSIYSSSTVEVAAGAKMTLTKACNAGMTPIAGGVYAEHTVVKYKDYVNYGDGADVEETVDNRDSAAQVVTMFASCAATSWFHNGQAVASSFAEDNQTHSTGGDASCPSGSIALSARVDWRTGNNLDTTDVQSIDYSGPTADMTGWFVTGRNLGTDKTLSVDLQCVDAIDLPGRFLVQNSWRNTASTNVTGHNLTANCPNGMALVNGGTYTLAADGSVQTDSYVGYTYRSYPNDPLTQWFASVEVPYQDTMYVSAWCIPNQAPTLTFLAKPPTYTSNATADFAFSATDPAAASGSSLDFGCSAGTIQFSPCVSPWTGTMTEGHHVFRVAVMTGDGRSTTLEYAWTYDRTPPTVKMAGTPAFSLASPITVGWSASDGSGSGVSGYSARYSQAKYTGGFAAPQYPTTWQHIASTSVAAGLTPGYTRCFAAKAVDRAGNQSAYAASTCTAMPVDDAALRASSKWTRVKNAAADWNGTYTRTTKKNATLTLKGVHLDRAGIVATTCPRCGRVAVLVGTTRLGIINLHSTTTKHRVVLAMSRFLARTGKVTIKVVSAGKLVRIDGLAVSQR